MEEACLLGLTVEDMKANTLTTKNKDMECLSGQMEENMMDSGLMENNMEKASIIPANKK